MACIRKRKYENGKFRYVLDFYDNNGKRVWKTLQEGTSLKSARDELRTIEKQLDRGTYVSNEKMPTFGKVANDWLEYKKQNIRISTWGSYEGHVRNHFGDFRETKIDKITIAKIEKFIGQKQDANTNFTTLKKLIVTLNQIFKYAVRHRYLDNNPVRDIERPRRTGDIEPEKISVLSPDEINSLIDAVDDPGHKTLIQLGIFSGARQGELIGLRWTDVDVFNNQIHIQRTFNHGRWFKPKTATSIRKIDIGPQMMENLRKWRTQCPESELNLCFPNQAGNPICQSHFLHRVFFPAMAKAGVKLRFHDLRHTYASLLIAQCENVKYIQNQLGHSSPMVTLSVYAHLMRDKNPESAQRLENTILGGTGSNLVANTKKRLSDV